MYCCNAAVVCVVLGGGWGVVYCCNAAVVCVYGM